MGLHNSCGPVQHPGKLHLGGWHACPLCTQPSGCMPEGLPGNGQLARQQHSAQRCSQQSQQVRPFWLLAAGRPDEAAAQEASQLLRQLPACWTTMRCPLLSLTAACTICTMANDRTESRTPNSCCLQCAAACSFTHLSTIIQMTLCFALPAELPCCCSLPRGCCTQPHSPAQQQVTDITQCVLRLFIAVCLLQHAKPLTPSLAHVGVGLRWQCAMPQIDPQLPNSGLARPATYVFAYLCLQQHLKVLLLHLLPTGRSHPAHRTNRDSDTQSSLHTCPAAMPSSLCTFRGVHSSSSHSAMAPARYCSSA